MPRAVALARDAGACSAGRRRPPRGFSLLEAIAAVVVVAIALGAISLALQTASRRSADPAVRLQMVAIAQGLLDEIALRPVAVAANAAPAGCARSAFNDVRDYNGYASSGVCASDGTAVAALAAYDVRVAVAVVTLDGAAGTLRVAVTVTRGADSLTLVGWRTDHA